MSTPDAPPRPRPSMDVPSPSPDPEPPRVFVAIGAVLCAAYAIFGGLALYALLRAAR